MFSELNRNADCPAPQSAQFGFGHLLQEQGLAALPLDRLPLPMQRVQAIAELRRDGRAGSSNRARPVPDGPDRVRARERA